MIQTTTINGRPAQVLFFNDSFVPVDDVDATLVRINYLDEAGGSAFLRRETASNEKSMIDVSRERATRWLREKYHGENPDERDDKGKFAPKGTASGDGVSADGNDGRFREFESAGINVSADNEAAFIERWDSRVGLTPAGFKEQYMDGLKGSMNLRYTQDGRLYIGGDVQDDQGKVIGTYSNDVHFGDRSAYVKRIEVEQEQGAGLGRRIMAANVEMYQKMGLDRVELEADMNVGCYAWFKYGLEPDDNYDLQRRLTSRLATLELAPEDKAIVDKLIKSGDRESWWALVDSEIKPIGGKDNIGKALLMKSETYPVGLTWQGILNFDDDDSMTRFRSYVRKAAATKSTADIIRLQRWQVAQARAMQTLER